MKIWAKSFLILVLGLFIAGAANADQDGEKLYYGIEQKGSVCGYSEVLISNTEIDGSVAIVLEESVFMKLSALGADFDTKINFKFLINPRTGKYFHNSLDIDQGTMKFGYKVDIDGGKAHIVSTGVGGGPSEIDLPSDVLLENTQIFYHIIEDFVNGGLKEKTYKSLDLIEGTIHEITYTEIGREQLELAGQTFDAIVLKNHDKTSAMKTKWWVDTKTGYALKAELPTRNIFLADASITENIVKADMNDDIFAKVNVSISDIKAISYMKARTVLEPGGGIITAESLNIPGQKFEGTVKENYIDGVFEVSHTRYDGIGAPPFPPDFRGDPILEKYLSPEAMIESDYLPLIERAQQITAGASNSWEAAKRLSKWVSTEIGPGVPGGGTAKGTFEMQMAECGGHSRLLAGFCRAVGIPCRVVWGCMYAPNYGGSFGQHAWDEVYMGEAGWIPVDATIKEIDFVDSGHLRLGVLTTKGIYLGFKEAEILDYTAGSVTMATAGSGEVPPELKPYLGKYKGPGGEPEILVQNASLAIDIPGKMVFELNEPNEEGLWLFKLTDAAGVSFTKDESGEVTEMAIISTSRLPRKKTSDSTVIKAGVPDEYQTYLGEYIIPMQNLVLTVIYKDGNLAVDDPKRGIIGLIGPDEEGLWTNEFDQNKISFVAGDEAQASALVFQSITRLPKILYVGGGN